MTIDNFLLQVVGSDNENVLVLAATNIPWTLDSARDACSSSNVKLKLGPAGYHSHVLNEEQIKEVANAQRATALLILHHSRS
jgi:hypothetical protein